MEYPDPFSLSGVFGSCSNGPPGRVHRPPVVDPPPPGPTIITKPAGGLDPDTKDRKGPIIRTDPALGADPDSLDRKGPIIRTDPAISAGLEEFFTGGGGLEL